LLNIISGLLVRVAIELAVFLLGETTGGGTTGSFGVLLESQANGLVSFRLTGGGGTGAGAGGGGGGGTAAGATAGGLLGGESTAGGDHGIAGRALVMLLKDMVFDFSFSPWLFSVLASQYAGAWEGLCDCWDNLPSWGETTAGSSSSFTSSSFTSSSEAADVCERRSESFLSAFSCFSALSATSVFLGVSGISFSSAGPSTCAVRVASTSSSESGPASFASSGGGERTEDFRWVSDRTSPVSTASSNVSCNAQSSQPQTLVYQPA